MQDTISSMFDYHRWADHRLLTACSELTDAQYAQQVGGSFPSIRALVAHLAASAEAWGRRLDGAEVTASSLLTEATVPNIETALRHLIRSYDAFQREARRPADELAQTFTYRNIKGVVISLPRWAVLRHLVNHGTYHRGQLAAMLRMLGMVPPATDLTLWAMEYQQTQQERQDPKAKSGT